MKRNLFVAIALLFCTSNTICWSQDSIRRIHHFSIHKQINKDNKLVEWYIEVDSGGTVHSNTVPAKGQVDIGSFTQGILKFIDGEHLRISHGNNDVYFIEPGRPKLNEQRVSMEIQFQDDMLREKDLRNKSYYWWVGRLDVDILEYPLYRYLTDKQVAEIKNFLK
jgi:hypothetical protein